MLTMRERTGLAKRENGKRTSLYTSWQHMKQRCLNPNNNKYPRYGGRGIKVCEEWLSIKNFSDWAYKNGWQEGYTIDRINNDGDYCPSNCRWIPRSENAKYKSTTKISFEQAQEIRKRIANGESSTAIAKDYGCKYTNLWFIKKNLTHVS